MNKKSINNAPRPPLNLRGGGRKAGGDIDAVDVQSLQEEIAILDQNWKRALADYQNLVKQTASERQGFIRFATSGLISGLIPPLDTLDLAAEHTEDVGIKMAVKMLHDALNQQGVEEIIPKVGDEFNPRYHECIEKVEGGSSHTIAEIISKGYKIGKDFIIRPAKVKAYV